VPRENMLKKEMGNVNHVLCSQS